MSSKIFPSTGEKPKFNPDAAYEAVQDTPAPKTNKPAFNPNKKYEAVDETPPVQQQKQEQQTFKPMTDWLTIPQAAQPIVQENAINDHNTKVAQSKERVNAHLSDIDNSVINIIHTGKKDIQNRLVSEKLGINPKEAGPANPQAQVLESKMRQDIPVAKEEVEDFKQRMSADIGMTRAALTQKAKDIAGKDPVAAKQLKADVYRLDRQNDPSKDDKISGNIEKINNGEYDYDIMHGQLVKPQGFFGSLVTGYKEKVDAFDDYDVYKSGDKNAILNRIKERTKYDPDKALPVAEEGWATHSLAEMGRGMGGQPIKPLIAGLVVARLGPQAAAAATAAVSVPEMYKLTFGSALPHNYEALKKQNPNLSEDEVLQKAIDLTDKQANTDAAIAGAMGGLGAKAGFAPMGLKNTLLQKSLSSALGQIGQEAVKKTVEGLGVGALGAGGQIVKNLMAQKAGIPTDIGEGINEQLWAGVGMTMAMTMIAKTPELLKPKTYNQLLQSIKNVPKEEVQAHLDGLEQTGQITSEQSQSAQKAIEEHQALDNSIKPNVPEADRIKVQELIKKRNEKQAALETEDEAYRTDTKKEIDDLNDQINRISKGQERGELQQLVDKESKDNTYLNVFRDASENDLKKYFKEIAEQAYDPNSEATTIETFGENIVNKAKELYSKVDKGNNALTGDELNRLNELYKKKFLKQSFTNDEHQEFINLAKRQIENKRQQELATPLNDKYENTILGTGQVIKGNAYRGANYTVSISENGDLSITKYNEKTSKNEIIHEQNYGSKENALKEFEKHRSEIDKEINEKYDNKLAELDGNKNKISVIQPGEIKQPEVRTIAPREQPKKVESTKNVSVIMPDEVSAGKMRPEQIGHVEVSEHGEDTKTAAGKENGIGPSPLTKEGMQEAKKLGHYIADNNKTKIITSEVERGLQTAEEAAKEAERITGKDVPIERNELLNTANIGSDEGKPEGTFKEKEWFEGKYMPDGAESPESFKARMEKAYEYVKSLPENTHVVSHSKVMRALDALSKTDGKWTDETTNIFLNNKEFTHAVQEPSAGSLLQHPQEGSGTEGSERGGMEPGKQGEEATGARAKEEGKTTSEEKAIAGLSVDETYGLPFIEEPGDKRTGIKNIISKTTRFERKLPPVEVGKLGTDQEILLEGKSLVDNNVINPLDVVNRILDTKEGMQPDEAKAMQYYMHQLAQQDTNLRERLAGASGETERAEINGQLQQLSDEIDAATQANIISGKAWSDVGNIRQIVSDTGFNASRDLATIKDAYQGKIPKDVQAKLDRALKERDEALNKLAKLQAEEKNKAAEDTIKKEGAPKNTKKTKEDFKNERTEIKKSISDKLRQSRSGQSGLTAVPLPVVGDLIRISPEIFKLIKSYAEEGIQKTEEVINRLHDVLKDEIDGVQKADIVNLLAGRYKAEGENVSKISQRIRDFRTEANLWTKIAEATKMEEDTPAKKQEKNKKLQDLRDRLNEIRTRNKEAIVAANYVLTTDVQKELNKLQRQRKVLETRYKNKKYLVPPEEKKTPFSEEILKEKQRIVNANYKIRVEKRKAFESQKNFYQKSLMWIGRGVRLSVLSGYNVLGKLASAATLGGAAKRIPEQAIGFIYGNAFKGIAEKAPIEGFVNASAEAKFYKEFFNPKKFVKNTWEILKSGESPLSKKFSPGTYEHIPGLYLPTDLHQVIKDPLKRATYEASLKNTLAWAERNGMDINDDLVIQSLETAAYKRAQYEIFQEQNWLSKKFGEWKHNMEESGNLGTTGKFLADFMIPVSTVPTNIARRMVATSPFGLIKGAANVIEAYRKGIENLTPEQADSVMRQLKQGTLGTALWLIGWYGYSQFGGLYSKFNPNKQRDQGDLASDEMSVGGKMIPKPVQHALPLEIIQFAATARRVYDNYRDNKDASAPESIEKAGLASIGALTEQIPVIETIAHTIGAFNNPYEAKKLEEDVRRRFEPQILRETGVIGKDKGGSGGGAGSTSGYSSKKTTKTKHTITHKIHR